MKNIFAKSPQEMAVTRRTFFAVLAVVVVVALFVLPRFSGTGGGGNGVRFTQAPTLSSLVQFCGRCLSADLRRRPYIGAKEH